MSHRRPLKLACYCYPHSFSTLSICSLTPDIASRRCERSSLSKFAAFRCPHAPTCIKQPLLSNVMPNKRRSKEQARSTHVSQDRSSRYHNRLHDRTSFALNGRLNVPQMPITDYSKRELYVAAAKCLQPGISSKLFQS